MKRWKKAVCICAFLFAASLAAVDTLPAFAVAVTADDGQQRLSGIQVKNGLVYLNGRLYNGYYMNRKGKMCSVKGGKPILKTGTVKAGTKYYKYNAKRAGKATKNKLYVRGKAYTGYYMNGKKKMYHVKKGIPAKKTGMLSARTKYYSFPAKKTRRLPRKAVYVGGKLYNGYYMSGKNELYYVKQGNPVLKTGMLDEGTGYYSYRAKKKKALSKQALYVKGKKYAGYYLDSRRQMYSAAGKTPALVNTALSAGTRYYSFIDGKMQTLPQMMVYVNGKAMEGMSQASLETLQRAQAAVARVTNSGMTQEQKLRACFEFVKAYKGGRPRTPHYTGIDWPVIYANDMFVNGRGNCCSYAAAFAYMAKALGYEEVYCCNDSGHGWAEIGGLIYDPERSKVDPAYSYYAVSYDTKTNVNYKGALVFMTQPWMHVKI